MTKRLADEAIPFPDDRKEDLPPDEDELPAVDDDFRNFLLPVVVVSFLPPLAAVVAAVAG